MEEIIKFVEDFAKAEAKAYSLSMSSDLEKYNQAITDMYSYVDPILNGKLGLLKKTENEASSDDLFMNLLGSDAVEANSDSCPRHLFKISEYEHDKYGKIWAAFVSLANHEEDLNTLDSVLFISIQGGEFRILSTSIYTDTATEGKEYQWENNGGYIEISFEELGEPISIERIKEPLDFNDSLRIYYSNM